MRIALLFVLLLISIASAAVAQEQSKRDTILASDLNRKDVIGQLGLPLGTVAEIRAEVVAGRDRRELHPKKYEDLYLLKVTHVNNTQLKDNPLLTFDADDPKSVGLARDQAELNELKRGKKSRRWSSEEIEELEKGYVGKSMQLMVYETGEFSGWPKNLRSTSATYAFQFSTRLVVLSEKREKDWEIKSDTTSEDRAMDDEPFAGIEHYVGKRVLVALTYTDANDKVTDRRQVHGTILRMNDEEGLVIEQADGKGEFSLPPELDALEPAAPGEYRNKRTGEVVVNPDYIGRWTIGPSGGDENASP